MISSVITISRQYGSGGRFIAKKLAEKLGIPFYDNEIITMAAKESGYAENLFERRSRFPRTAFCIRYPCSARLPAFTACRYRIRFS